ncbi:MAG: hypothetical protein ACMUIG_06405 [Thermoplasmatota archaeon]
MAGKNRKKGAGSVLGWASTVAVVAMIAAAGVASLYLYLEFLDRQRHRDGFSSRDLMVPAGNIRNFTVEEPPLYIQGGPAPQYSCSLGWYRNDDTGLMIGYEGFGSMFNFHMENKGPSDLYIEDINVELGWGTIHTRSVGRYVDTGTEADLGHLFIPIPEPLPEESKRTYKVSVGILIEGSQAWIRGKDAEFETSGFDLRETGRSNPNMTYERNTYYLYDRIVPKIEKDLPRLISIAENNSLGGDGFDVQDIADVFEFVKHSIDYIPDSSSSADQWYSPCETMDRGGGDCEDWAMLFSGLITAIGGTSRVIITKGHAFSAVYLGENSAVLNDIQNRYGTTIPFLLWKDDLGTWLIVEPQSNLIFGWLPIDCLPATDPIESMRVYGMPRMGWACDGSETISIVDIYL